MESSVNDCRYAYPLSLCLTTLAIHIHLDLPPVKFILICWWGDVSLVVRH